MIKKSYRAILADLDGTVNRGDRLVPGAEEVYRELTESGVRWVFLSNNATVLAADLAEKISALGLPVSENQVVTSASALIDGLKKECPTARVMVVGEERLSQGLRNAGIRVENGTCRVDLVVTAMDRHFDYEKLRKAQAALLAGALFWATNLDASLPVADGFLPGAGSIVAAISTAAGRTPDRVFGKPSPDMASLVLELLGLPAALCLVVGDRMETDILFSRNAGIDSALVLTGATSREDLARFPYTPDYLFDSISDLRTLFR